MKTIISTSLILVLAACAGPTKMYAIPNGLGELSVKNPISCKFEKQLALENNLQSSSWYFWRQPQRTETLDDLSGQGEIWEKNKAGQLFYTRLFYKERVALEFVPGDLAAIGNVASWQQLSSLIEPSTLGRELSLQGKDSLGDIVVEHYSGSIRGVPMEVDWLPSLQLPLRMVKKASEGQTSLTLLECAKEPKWPIKPINKGELDSFRHLDYTDLGDMEDDPMVKHLEQVMGTPHHKH